ncbi:MAG: ribosome silencing factor [Betaproteobacteria bacterium]|nr:ribosome silencing factor [Betaproteobacteria bacterium]
MAKKKLSTVIIDALEEIKGRDIKLIDVSKITSVFDKVAIASADSTRQTKALARNVHERVKEAGYEVIGIEGEQGGEWVLVDCGDVVVHIMQPAVREYYKLEELWADGKAEFPKPAASRKRSGSDSTAQPATEAVPTPAKRRATTKPASSADEKAASPKPRSRRTATTATSRTPKAAATSKTAAALKPKITKPKIAKPKADS